MHMKEIVIKYLEDRATKEEKEKLLAWLRNKENRIVFNSYSLDWKKSLDSEQLPFGSEEVWNKIQAHLLQRSFSRWQKTFKTQQILKIAAIFFFLLSIGSLIYLFSNRQNSTPEFFTNVIADCGQISKVKLPDGSMVWLNSGSQITYSNLFSSKNRNINLEGEAYFKVTRNTELPLIVSCNEIQVKVLGTEFNVTAYPRSKHIDVVLEKGSIELLNKNVESFSYKIKPGERASFNKTNRKLQVSNVNTSKFTSWKEGVINIYNQSLEELAERLKVRYNQKFIIGDDVKNIHYTFTINNESIDEIIKLMEGISPIKAIQKNDTILFKLDKNKKRMVEGKI